ncbi:hypothetical protein Fot_12777 [Forsythia ovata]|uniref:Uncharacterized protein n=1 Tax=Forsythia ovata TaxID=205694 RepID=A0ABD1W1N4_9LAMI
MSDDRGASITRTATATRTATERQSPEQRGPGDRGASIGGGRVNGGSPALVISRAKKWGRFLESGRERERVRNEGRTIVLRWIATYASGENKFPHLGGGEHPCRNMLVLFLNCQTTPFHIPTID